MNKMKQATIPLNYESYMLLKELTPIIEDEQEIGGMFHITMTEQQMSEAMYFMDGKEEYKPLKDWMQKIGEEQLGW